MVQWQSPTKLKLDIEFWLVMWWRWTLVNCLHKNGWTATSTYGVKGGDGGRENETKMDLALLKWYYGINPLIYL